ncbi:MAG: LTA synthase family protein [Solobacterium sp.]|nr:LTA synthase family protein [Solobacterium sp.]
MEKLRKNLFKYVSAAAGILLLVFNLLERQTFFACEEYGTQLFAVSLAMCFLVVLIGFIHKKRSDRVTTVYGAVLFFAAPLLMETGVELLNGNFLWDISNPANIWFNYAVYLMLELIFYALSGSVRFSIITDTAISAVFGIVNMFVKEYKGSPLLPWDVLSIRTAGNVAASFEYTANSELVFSVTLFVLIAFLALIAQKRELKFRKWCRAVSLCVFLAVSGVFYLTEVPAKVFGAAPDFFNQTRGYEMMGAFAEFFVNTKYLSLKKPDGYDAASLEAKIDEAVGEDTVTITETALSETPGSAQKPDIIVIMNESFSDLSVIGDFQTNKAYMPYIDSLKDEENVIQGNVYVSTIGTGTSNTEYEFLTGNPMAFLPLGSNAYQLYVDDTLPGMVSSVKDKDYTALTFHPYYESSWNRVSVYGHMGFEDFISIEDLKTYVKVRRFVSDMWDFNHIIDMYEERDPSKPFFLFNITMQNHSSYEKKYANFQETVHLEGLSRDYPLTDQYLSLINTTDNAFRTLVEYFAKCERPVILLMFGDHQPFIENGFYEEVMGKKLSAMDDAQAQKRYITRFVMYANYDIPEGWVDKISVNYLGTLLMENTGLPLTKYQKYQQAVYPEVPVITALGCLDKDGAYFHEDDPGEYKDLLNLYEQASYNVLRDHKHMVPSLFYIEK